MVTLQLQTRGRMPMVRIQKVCGPLQCAIWAYVDSNVYVVKLNTYTTLSLVASLANADVPEEFRDEIR